MPRKPQDTIEYSASAEEIVVNSTVKIIAQIAGMIKSDLSEQKLKDAIRDVMKKFIDTDWQFSNMNRTAHQSGMEQVTLTATARVPEAENYALDRRREDASRDLDWMRIVSVQTDTSPTASQIEETQSKLRVAILQKTQKELEIINATMGGTYRIGRVIFDPPSEVSPHGATMAAMSAPRAYGSGFNSGQDIGNAIKLTMVADIELRITR